MKQINEKTKLGFVWSYELICPCNESENEQKALIKRTDIKG